MLVRLRQTTDLRKNFVSHRMWDACLHASGAPEVKPSDAPKSKGGNSVVSDEPDLDMMGHRTQRPRCSYRNKLLVLFLIPLFSLLQELTSTRLVARKRTTRLRRCVPFPFFVIIAVVVVVVAAAKGSIHNLFAYISFFSYSFRFVVYIVCVCMYVCYRSLFC